MTSGDERQVVYKLPKLYRFLLAWFLFFLLLAYDPIGEGPYKDRMLVGLANYLAAPAYPSEARNQIVLVMADTVSLAELGLSWPLPFADQSDVIGKILQHEPRVLALDLLFVDHRDGEGLEFLEDTIAGSTVPIIGAAAPPVGAPTQRRQILPLSVEADITVRTEWQNLGYRLTGGGQGESPARPSLALAIYKEACSRKGADQDSTIDKLCEGRLLFDEAAFEREMLVFWGTGAPDYGALFQHRMDIADDLFRCARDSSSSWERVVRMFVRQESAPRETCAFHPVLPLDLLMNLDDDVLDAALADRIVIYGIDHPGIPDIVDPPTSHPIPGVHLHAMALDNLLTFGSEYFGTATAPLWGVGSIDLPALKFIVAFFIFWVIFALLLSSQTGEKGPLAKTPKKKKAIRDFADVKAALWLLLQRIGPTSIRNDVAAGLSGWNRKRNKRLRKAGRSPRVLAIWVGWFLGLLPVLVGHTSTGRVALFVCLFALIVYLDVNVLMVPPINALTLSAILLASQLIVPAEVFSPRRRRRKKAKGAARAGP